MGLDSRGVLRAGLLGEVHQLVGILTDEPLLVVAGDVVPHLVKLQVSICPFYIEYAVLTFSETNFDQKYILP